VGRISPPSSSVSHSKGSLDCLSSAGPWNWERGGVVGFGLTGIPNVVPDLATAIRRNPELEVLP
jgi:hypothetical protein